jgi:hypothetical protein
MGKNEIIALSLDELEQIPTWIPALTRGGYTFAQQTEPGRVTGWDVIVPNDQVVARAVVKLKGLTVFTWENGRWQPKRQL